MYAYVRGRVAVHVCRCACRCVCVGVRAGVHVQVHVPGPPGACARPPSADTTGGGGWHLLWRPGLPWHMRACRQRPRGPCSLLALELETRREGQGLSKPVKPRQCGAAECDLRPGLLGDPSSAAPGRPLPISPGLRRPGPASPRPSCLQAPDGQWSARRCDVGRSSGLGSPLRASDHPLQAPARDPTGGRPGAGAPEPEKAPGALCARCGPCPPQKGTWGTQEAGRGHL